MMPPPHQPIGLATSPTRRRCGWGSAAVGVASGTVGVASGTVGVASGTVGWTRMQDAGTFQDWQRSRHVSGVSRG
eukprot:5613773-Prymnesium_polylepis.1